MKSSELGMLCIPDDKQQTKMRKAIEALYSRRGIVPTPEKDFKCGCLQSCKATAELPLITGSWPYIGSAYGKARIGEREVRILFVAMDTGGEEADMKFEDAQCGFRCLAEKPRKPHMGSVHMLLRELVDDKDPCVFSRQFALTNAVKCRPDTKNMRAVRCGRMITNCAGHLEQEIETLQPMLIVTQGDHPFRTVKRLSRFAAEEALATFKGEPRGIAEVFCSKDRVILFRTPHSRVKGLRWKQPQIPAFLAKAAARARESLRIT
jgi:hypothetical protein